MPAKSLNKKLDTNNQQNIGNNYCKSPKKSGNKSRTVNISLQEQIDIFAEIIVNLLIKQQYENEQNK
jgi:hypothetical protein